MMQKKLPIISIFIALFVLLFALLYTNYIDGDNTDFSLWILRILVALAASVISSFIPGMIILNYNTKGKIIVPKVSKIGSLGKDDIKTIEPMTLADSQPKIVASGAIVIFVLVYFFEPLSEFLK